MLIYGMLTERFYCIDSDGGSELSETICVEIPVGAGGGGDSNDISKTRSEHLAFDLYLIYHNCGI